MPMDNANYFQLFRLTTTNHNGGNVGDRLNAIFIRGDYYIGLA